jgi:hypothetical protein
MNTEESTATVLKYNLSRLLPLRVVLKKVQISKPDNTIIETWNGLCENSFSMGWMESRVRVWWSGKAYSMLGEHYINGIDDAKHNCRDSGEIIFDPLSDDCPIEIDWEMWTKAKTKFDQRNAIMKVKEIK